MTNFFDIALNNFDYIEFSKFPDNYNVVYKFIDDGEELSLRISKLKYFERPTVDFVFIITSDMFEWDCDCDYNHPFDTSTPIVIQTRAGKFFYNKVDEYYSTDKSSDLFSRNYQYPFPGDVAEYALVVHSKEIDYREFDIHFINDNTLFMLADSKVKYPMTKETPEQWEQTKEYAVCVLIADILNTYNFHKKPEDVTFSEFLGVTKALGLGFKLELIPDVEISIDD